MAHAVLGENDGQAFTEVALAVDVEEGADVGDLVGEEGEGVFLLLVDGIVGAALHALAIGGVVQAQRAGLAAVGALPSHQQRPGVAVGIGG